MNLCFAIHQNSGEIIIGFRPTHDIRLHVYFINSSIHFLDELRRPVQLLLTRVTLLFPADHLLTMDCTESALRLRLAALSCPFLSTLTLSDQHDQQKLLVWLEDAHIRRLPIPKRALLRRKKFHAELQSYLRKLGLPPAEESDLAPTVAHLIDLALSLCYSDNAVQLAVPPDPWNGRCVPVVPGAATDEAVIAAVKDLLAALDVDGQPVDAAEGAQVAADMVEALVSRTDDDEAEITGEEGDAALDALPLGFSAGDPVMDRFAKVVRVLQVGRLRELQDSVNAAIAKMQAVTADPKTDSKLGKVGR